MMDAPSILALNPAGVETLPEALKVAGSIPQRQFPLVLGGDCSILSNCMLALRRLGKWAQLTPPLTGRAPAYGKGYVCLMFLD